MGSEMCIRDRAMADNLSPHCVYLGLVCTERSGLRMPPNALSFSAFLRCRAECGVGPARSYALDNRVVEKYADCLSMVESTVPSFHGAGTDCQECPGSAIDLLIMKASLRLSLAG